MTEINKLVRGIFEDALVKYDEGEKKYGELEIMKDPRNFLKEAETEILDAMVYYAFEVIRIRRLNDALNRLAKEHLNREMERVREELKEDRVMRVDEQKQEAP